MLASRRDILRLGAASAAVMVGAQVALGPEPGSAAGKIVLEPFDPGVAPGEKPGLPPVVAYLAITNSDWFVTISKTLKASTESRGLTYLTSTYDGDESKLVDQFEGFLARGVGAMFLHGSAPGATRPLQERALAEGIFLHGQVMDHVDQCLNINQYESGWVQAQDAVRWVKESYGRKARVLYFNEDKVEFLRPRHQGVLDALKTLGDQVEVVSDVQIDDLSADGGMRATSSILQAHPDLNVIMGSAGIVSGSYAVFDAAGRTNDPTLYLSGISPGPAELALVRKGGIYRATVTHAIQLLCYAGGQSAADWLDGKSVPQGLSCDNLLLRDSKSIDAFLADMADPAATWGDVAKRDSYVRRWGNISYSTRDRFLTEIWEPTRT